MATRRRRNTATNTEIVSTHIPDGAWDDFSAEAPEVLEAGMTPEEAKKFHDWEKSQIDNAIDIARKVGAEAPELTHEEMLEIAEEREAEPAIEEEEEAVEVFLAMAAADTFEAIQKAEEENKTSDFLDPDFYKEEIRHPAQPTDYVAEAPAPAPKRRPRYILRAETRRRKG